MIFSAGKNKTLMLYILLWVVVATIHMLIIKLGYHVPFIYAFADSLTFNTLFALFGLGLWYLALYSNLKKLAVVEIIVHHLTATSITVIIWLSAGFFILKQIIGVDLDYVEFLNSTRTVRIISGVLYYVIMIFQSSI